MALIAFEKGMISLGKYTFLTRDCDPMIDPPASPTTLEK
jgi:hypothetical protein